MPKNMILGFDPLLNGIEQLQTACPASVGAQVPVAQGRAMGNEDVHAFRDEIPLVQTRLASREVECPVAEFWLPVRAGWTVCYITNRHMDILDTQQ